MVRIRNTKDVVREKLLTKRTTTKNGCWIWQGAKHQLGCGQIMISGKSRFVHRVSMEIFRNITLSSKEIVVQTCDSKLCFNPDHLKVYKRGQNIRGENNVKAKLSPTIVRNIVDERRGKNVSYRKLGEKHGVSPGTARNICEGTTWSHLRVNRPSGQAHGLRALGDKDIEEIRKMRGLGLKLKYIAKIYEVSESLISRVCNYTRVAAAS